MSVIRKLILHCSDSPDTVDIGAAEIRLWHIRDRGWSDIGYHYVVRRSGIVEVGRYENGDSVLEGKEIGAHTKGENSDSLGICWVGRDSITPEQKSSLLKLTLHLLKQHGLTAADVYGHSEYNPTKTCPRLDMDGIRKALIAIGVA